MLVVVPTVVLAVVLVVVGIVVLVVIYRVVTGTVWHLYAQGVSQRHAAQQSVH